MRKTYRTPKKARNREQQWIKCVILLSFITSIMYKIMKKGLCLIFAPPTARWTDVTSCQTQLKGSEL